MNDIFFYMLGFITGCIFSMLFLSFYNAYLKLQMKLNKTAQEMKT